MRLRRAGWWLAQDSGQGLVEYALILALASVGLVFALLILQNSIGTTLQDTSQRIDAATAGAGGQAIPGEPLGGGTETGAVNPGGADGGGNGHGHGHGNGKGNNGNGNGNGGPNGRK